MDVSARRNLLIPICIVIQLATFSGRAGLGKRLETPKVNLVDILRGMLGLQDKEKLHYRLKGKLRVEGGFMMPSVIPFESKGEFSFKGLPETG